MSIDSVMLSNHLILCFPFPPLPSILLSSESFPMSQLFASAGQSTGASASATVLMNIQGWFPLGLTALISLAYSHWASLIQSLQTFPAPTHLCPTFLIFPVLGTTFCLPSPATPECSKSLCYCSAWSTFSSSCPPVKWLIQLRLSPPPRSPESIQCSLPWAILYLVTVIITCV